jgi:hypothetical protein
LTGPDGLLKALTKTVIETALEEETSEHLGYGKHETVGRNRGNSRNGKRAKTMLSDACGEVDIEAPGARARERDDDAQHLLPPVANSRGPHASRGRKPYAGRR